MISLQNYHVGAQILDNSIYDAAVWQMTVVSSNRAAWGNLQLSPRSGDETLKKKHD